MNMIKYELNTLFRDRILWVVVLIAVLLECFFFWSVSDRSTVSPSEYRKLKDIVANCDIDRAIRYLSFKDDLSDTESQILKELNNVQMYPTYIDDLLIEVKDNQKSTLYQTLYEQDYLSHAEESYSRLKDNTLSFVGGYGLEKALAFKGRIIVHILLILIYIYRYFLREKKNGMRDLTHASLKGRKLGLYKQFSMVLFTIITGVLLYGADVLMGIILYGTVQFDASIQSLSTCFGTALPLSIGGYIITFMIYYLLVTILISELLTLLSLISSNEFIFFVYCAILCFTTYLLSLLPDYGIWSILRGLAFSANIAPENFCEFYYYNIFGCASYRLTVNICFYVLLTLITALVTYLIYRKTAVEYRLPVLIHKKKMKWTKRFHGQLSLEIYKEMIGYRILVLMIILGLFSLSTLFYREYYMSEEEFYYAGYMKKVEGEWTEQKEDYLESEYESCNRELENIESKQDVMEPANQSRIRVLSLKISALRRCLERNEYIKGEDLTGTGFIYERGWNYALGYSAYKKEIWNAILALVSTVLFSVALWGGEYVYRMEIIEKMTINHRRRNRNKTYLGLAIIFFIILVIYGFDYLWIDKKMGLNGSSYALGSIPQYEMMPLFFKNMSIGGFLLLLTVIRLMFLIVVMWGIGKCVKCTGSMGITVLLGGVIFVLPIILYLVGILGNDRFTAMFFMSGKVLFGY